MVKKHICHFCLTLLLTFGLTASPVASQESLPTDNSVPFTVNDLNLSQASQKTPRIIGGIEADEGDWPWMAALISAGEDAHYGQFCGGTLIHDEWVVTAAHCTLDSKPEDIEVLLDAHNLAEDQGRRFSVDAIIEHENYNPFTNDADISLLHLSEAAPQETIALVEQGDPDRVTTPFTTATVIGWGSTDPFGYQYPEALRQVDVSIVPMRYVFRVYGARNITINMLAAGSREEAKDSCSGDSGGPLMVKDASGEDWLLAGITSWGIGCARPRYPGVYARVSRFTSWVESKIEMWGLQQDKDKDGVPDIHDMCPNTDTSTYNPVDPDGCGQF